MYVAKVKLEGDHLPEIPSCLATRQRITAPTFGFLSHQLWSQELWKQCPLKEALGRLSLGRQGCWHPQRPGGRCEVPQLQGRALSSFSAPEAQVFPSPNTALAPCRPPAGWCWAGLLGVCLQVRTLTPPS